MEKYKVETAKVTQVIGNPLNYDEYIKQGKKNPNGSNVYQISSEQGNKYQYLLDD